MATRRLVSRLATSPELVLKGAKDPVLTSLVLNKVVHQHRKGRAYNRDGFDVFEQDWDNLIILDACRYDEYVKATPFDGTPERRESRGTSSDQWVYGNFHGKQLHDVVYVSGNQWFLALESDGALDSAVHQYHDIDRDAFDGYVPSPETTTQAALECAKQYPDKRLLVHYMQPHKPYFGQHREQFEIAADEDLGLRSIMRKYGLDRETLRSAYRDNLRIVLEHVEELVDALDGKTVLSSDHGELLGERLWPIPVPMYGHPSRTYVEELLTVPWHVVSEGPRRTTTAEPPQQPIDVDTGRVEENLRNLGYKM